MVVASIVIMDRCDSAGDIDCYSRTAGNTPRSDSRYFRWDLLPNARELSIPTNLHSISLRGIHKLRWNQESCDAYGVAENGLRASPCRSVADGAAPPTGIRKSAQRLPQALQSIGTQRSRTGVLAFATPAHKSGKITPYEKFGKTGILGLGRPNRYLLRNNGAAQLPARASSLAVAPANNRGAF